MTRSVRTPERNVLSAEEVTTALADAYRTAALAREDMPRVSEALESLRSQLARSDAYDVWDGVDTALAGFFYTSLERVLVELRARFRSALEEQQLGILRRLAIIEPQRTRDTWLDLWVTSFVRSKSEHLRRLSAYDVDLPSELDPRDELGRLTRVVMEERWTDLHSFLAEFADRCSDAHVAARAQAACAQIQLFHLSWFKKAAAHVDRAAALGPGVVAVVGVRGDYAAEWGDISLAKQINRELIAMAPDQAIGYANLAKIFARQGDRTAAESAYHQAVEQAPGSSLGYRGLVSIYARAEAFDAHRDEIERLVSQLDVLTEDRLGSLLLMADQHLDARRYDEARAAYQTLLDRDAEFFPALYGLALVDARVSNLEGVSPERASELRGSASQALEAIVARAPTQVNPYLTLAWLAMSGNDVARALAQCERAERACGEGFLVRIANTRAEILLESKSYGPAEDELTRVLAADPGNREALGLLSRLADGLVYDAGNVDGAKRLYEVAHLGWGELGDAAYYNRLGNLRYYESAYAEAADCYRKAIDRKNDDHVMHSNLAGALAKLTPAVVRAAHLGEAVRALQQAVALAPMRADYRERLAAASEEGEFVAKYGADALDWAPHRSGIVLHVEQSLRRFLLDDSGQRLHEPLAAAMGRLRDRIHGETGVVLPGVTFSDGAGVSATGECALVVDGVTVDRGVWQSEPRGDTAIEAVASTLEEKVRPLLAGFVTPDTMFTALGGGGDAREAVRQDPHRLLAVTLRARRNVVADGAIGDLDHLVQAVLAARLDAAPAEVSPARALAPVVEVRLPEGALRDTGVLAADLLKLRAKLFEETGLILPAVGITVSKTHARASLVLGDAEIDVDTELRPGGGADFLRVIAPFAVEVIASAEYVGIKAPLVETFRRAERDYLRPLASTLGALWRTPEQEAQHASRLGAAIVDAAERAFRSRITEFVTIMVVKRYLSTLAEESPRLVQVCRALIGIPGLASVLSKVLDERRSIANLQTILMSQLESTFGYLSNAESASAVPAPAFAGVSAA